MGEQKPRYKIKEDGTLAGCIGLDKPIPPNVCDKCARHSDLTCSDIRKAGGDGKQ